MTLLLRLFSDWSIWPGRYRYDDDIRYDIDVVISFTAALFGLGSVPWKFSGECNFYQEMCERLFGAIVRLIRLRRMLMQNYEYVQHSSFSSYDFYFWAWL